MYILVNPLRLEEFIFHIIPSQDISLLHFLIDTNQSLLSAPRIVQGIHLSITFPICLLIIVWGAALVADNDPYLIYIFFLLLEKR